jgi:hypothetical protein
MSAFKGAILLGLLVTMVGCATAATSTGNQSLQGDRVAQIKKGVTTRAEVEQIFGAPNHVQLMGDGRRTMIYTGMQGTRNNAGDIAWCIPFVGPLVGGKNTSSRRLERLQVVLNKAEVVEDYEFSDTTTDSQSSNSVLNGEHQNETTTANH